MSIAAFREKHGLSGSTLKIFAIITMLIDHTGAAVIGPLQRKPYITADLDLMKKVQLLYRISRAVGRLAFPIFCFLLVEGFLHTRDVKKYAGRLFLFALISEFPFDFALKPTWYYPQKQNVYFTLLFALLALWGVTLCEGRVVLQLMILTVGLMTTSLFRTDYSYKGVFLIEMLYIFRHTRLYQCIGGAASIAWERYAPLAFIPVYFYNGKRGRSLKYFFYIFYPAHLLILGCIRHYVL